MNDKLKALADDIEKSASYAPSVINDKALAFAPEQVNGWCDRIRALAATLTPLGDKDREARWLAGELRAIAGGGGRLGGATIRTIRAAADELDRLAESGGGEEVCGSCIGRGRRDIAHGETAPCELCNGSGITTPPAAAVDKPCKECHGDGYVYLAGRPAHPGNMVTCDGCKSPPTPSAGVWTESQVADNAELAQELIGKGTFGICAECRQTNAPGHSCAPSGGVSEAIRAFLEVWRQDMEGFDADDIVTRMNTLMELADEMESALAAAEGVK